MKKKNLLLMVGFAVIFLISSILFSNIFFDNISQYFFRNKIAEQNNYLALIKEEITSNYEIIKMEIQKLALNDKINSDNISQKDDVLIDFFKKSNCCDILGITDKKGICIISPSNRYKESLQIFTENDIRKFSLSKNTISFRKSLDKNKDMYLFFVTPICNNEEFLFFAIKLNKNNFIYSILKNVPYENAKLFIFDNINGELLNEYGTFFDISNKNKLLFFSQNQNNLIFENKYLISTENLEETNYNLVYAKDISSDIEYLTNFKFKISGLLLFIFIILTITLLLPYYFLVDKIKKYLLLKKNELHSISAQFLYNNLEKTNEFQSDDILGNIDSIFFEIKDMKEFYNSTFENMNAIKMIIDYETGFIININAAGCDFYGYTKEDLLRMNINEINILSEDEIKKEMLHAKLLQKNYFNFKHRLSDGTIRDVEVYSKPIEYKNNKYLFSIIHDITDKVLIEKEKKETYEHIMMIANVVPMMIIGFDIYGNTVFWNNECKKVTGYSKKDVANFDEFIKIIINENQQKDFYSLINEETDFYGMRYQINTKRQTERAVNFYNISYRYPVKGWQRWLVAIDVTQKEENQKALESREKLFSMVLKSNPNFIFIKDLNGKFIFYNDSFATFFGINETELIGNTFESLINDASVLKQINYEDNLLINRYRIYIENTRHLKNRTGEYRWLETIKTVILDEYGDTQYIVGLSTDITKIKEQEKELILAKENAAYAQDAKNKFIDKISHEIRTPLNGILGVLGLLEDTILEPKQQEFINLMKYSSKQLNVVINSLIDISNIEKRSLKIHEEKFNIESFLKEIYNDFSSKNSNKDLLIDLDINEIKFPDLIGDKDKTKKILENIIENAIKYTNKGNVLISIKEVPINNDIAWIEFLIKDSGIGIADEKINVVFDSFVQIGDLYTRQYEGLGIGLAITKKLVNLLGGSIDIESKENIGTSVIFKLPFRIERIIEQKVIKEAKTEFNKNDINILVAEDDMINKLYILKLLMLEGFKADSARNGHEVLEKLKTGNFNMILMDISMPEMDGIEATKIIRSQSSEYGNIPIIALTAHVYDEDREKCLKAGMNEYLAKPLIVMI